MHQFRFSASRQIEIINQSLEVYEEMKDHLNSCTECNDDKGLCTGAKEIEDRLKAAQQQLQRIGLRP
jgi:hypothetical protein